MHSRGLLGSLESRARPGRRVRQTVRRRAAPDPRLRPADAPGDALEKPLGQRERVTLLTIIAALAEHAKIDISKPFKAGETIEALTAEMGAKVAAGTVANHLKKIPDLLERRGKPPDD